MSWKGKGSTEYPHKEGHCEVKHGGVSACQAPLLGPSTPSLLNAIWEGAVPRAEERPRTANCFKCAASWAPSRQNSAPHRKRRPPQHCVLRQHRPDKVEVRQACRALSRAHLGVQDGWVNALHSMQCNTASPKWKKSDEGRGCRETPVCYAFQSGQDMRSTRWLLNRTSSNQTRSSSGMMASTAPMTSRYQAAGASSIQATAHLSNDKGVLNCEHCRPVFSGAGCLAANDPMSPSSQVCPKAVSSPK